MSHHRLVLSAGVVVAALLTACSPSGPEGERPPSVSAAAAPTPIASGNPDSASLVVYKESTCPCCNKWVSYMRSNGFRVVTYDVSDLNAVKEKHGLDEKIQSCHTTEVGGYFVEGHVPAGIVRRLLAERPRIAGIAVPGMPVGSPGMEVGPPEPYDVLGVDSAGRTTVFARIGN